MMNRYMVRLTRGAERDLDDIASYLAREASPAIASAFLDGMLEKAAELEAFPERGAVPRELDALGISTFRQLSAKPYRIIYRVGTTDVAIILIADCRRDMQALLERRLLGLGL
ncbi:type II toxin-antitoxin system RelE/ParE family toxin (plasmid) [Pseudanabaena biceps]|nr:type II toxin-antitoxin system RelE/ParE family toxin [Pseudanabaena biceps]